MWKFLSRSLSLIFFIVVYNSCIDKTGNIIKEIKIGTHNNNELKIQIDVVTNADVKVIVEYWEDSIGSKEKISSVISKTGLSHSIILCNIIPETNYSFQMVTIKGTDSIRSKTYTFTSRKLPEWLQEQFKYSCTNLELLPSDFKNGFLLMNKRETPGIAYIVDYKGRLRWYHTVDGTGYKVVHFTKDTTIIGILGKNDEPTSYGSEILEVNLSGDTILYLKKGHGELKYSIHHEILKKNRNEIVTLFVDQKIIDLRGVGGVKKDTINGDGILIIDNTGKKLWKWSVFDVMDPLKDLQLLKTKKDWMHANSLNYDKDSNFIISFYNNGQIWKLDAKSGKVIWKYGKGGTIAMPAECNFSQAHAVHINPFGSMMFFDNGVEKKQSEVFAVKLDEAKQTATIDLHIKLPVEIYNERMGSAYIIGDSTVLCCCSKKHITVLSNRKGGLLWTLESAIPPYRVEFLKQEMLAPFLYSRNKN